MTDFDFRDGSFQDMILDGLAGKVNVVPGKGLSTEDYTSADKGKLGALPDNSTLSSALNSITARLDSLEATMPEDLAGTTNSNGYVDFTFAKTYTNVPKVHPSVIGGGDTTHGTLCYTTNVTTTGCRVYAMKTQTVGVLLGGNIDPDATLGAGVTINLLVKE